MQSAFAADDRAFDSLSFPVVAAGSLPDLAVTILSHQNFGPTRSKQVEVEVRIDNLGSVDAGAFYVRFEGGEDPASEQRVNGLAAGDSIVITNTRGIGSEIPFTYSVRVIVDSRNDLHEGNEENNTAQINAP